MAILRFDIKKVLELCEHAKAATEWGATYEGPAKGPALWLVGDNGVYLMSNGNPPIPSEPKGNNVCYADGINPNKDDDWWEAKGAAFGHDDGVETLDCVDQLLEWVKEAPGITAFTVELSATQMKIGVRQPVDAA